MRKTIDQQIAETQDKLSRLKQKQQAITTRQKIIVGSLVIEAALQDKAIAETLMDILLSKKLRATDVRVIEPLIERLAERLP